MTNLSSAVDFFDLPKQRRLPGTPTRWIELFVGAASKLRKKFIPR